MKILFWLAVKRLFHSFHLSLTNYFHGNNLVVMDFCIGNVLYNLVDSLMNGQTVDCFFGSSFKYIACWEDKDLYTCMVLLYQIIQAFKGG